VAPAEGYSTGTPKQPAGEQRSQVGSPGDGRHTPEAMQPTLTIVIWNVEWRTPGSADGRDLRAAIAACEPDIVCITEGTPDFLDLPHRIEASADYGYPLVGNRRKVLLWSRLPWEAVDVEGDPEMPPGRYVAGKTLTPIGSLTVHGVCIPWSRAHVESGRKDRKLWEEHRQYLDGLGRVLRRAEAATPAIVVGDYNQRIPRKGAPIEAHNALREAFLPEFRVATRG
jgi:hypothetical protein